MQVENTEINQAIESLNIEEAKLVLVNRPQDMLGASADIDQELHKLAWNLKILAVLIRKASDEYVRLEKSYNSAVLREANRLTVTELSKLGLVKSDKFKYIKALLHAEIAERDFMENKKKYFSDMWRTYQEWTNTYKKTREIPDRYH